MTRRLFSRAAKSADQIIAAIADQIAQKGQALGAGGLRMGQAGVQRLAVGMEVGKQGKPHENRSGGRAVGWGISHHTGRQAPARRR